MDLRLPVVGILATTGLLLVLAAAAVTGLRAVSGEAEDVTRRLDGVVRIDPVHTGLLLLAELPPDRRAEALERLEPDLRDATLRLRRSTADGPLATPAERLGTLVDAVCANPADDDALREAIPAARILRVTMLDAAREALVERADRPAAARARWILYGAVASTVLASLVLAFVITRDTRARRAARDRVRRAEALAGLGTLAAGIAHEVNNPVGTVVTCLEAAARKLRAEPPDTDRALDLLRTAGEEAHRAGAIVRGLIDLARDGPPAAGPVDLAALVTETGRLAALNPRLRATPVDLDLAPDLPVILGDGGRLKQALLNLLANAAAVSPEGSPVELRVRAADGGVAVSVRDHGPGVPRAERDRIFEPFRTGRSDGTGLGLTIVETVVRAHGGSITVDDADGGGAVFTLYLPAHPPATRRSDGSETPHE